MVEYLPSRLPVEAGEGEWVIVVSDTEKIRKADKDILKPVVGHQVVQSDYHGS